MSGGSRASVVVSGDDVGRRGGGGKRFEVARGVKKQGRQALDPLSMLARGSVHLSPSAAGCKNPWELGEIITAR